MVTRSSIDPIEEARARVRLRYMRGRAASPGMAKIGVAAERLTRKSGAKKLPPIQVLKARWREIAGEQLYKYCRPERLSGGQQRGVKFVAWVAVLAVVAWAVMRPRKA